MIADPLERPPRVGVRVAPGVVDVQRGAVVDEPRPAVPDEEVRVLGRAIRVRHERIEPDDVGREVGIDDVARGRRSRVERQRTGQEVHAQVQAAAGAHQVVDLLVRLGVAEGRVDLDRHEVGHGQADRPGQLAGQPFGDERARPLAGAAELDHVQAVVVGLDEAGQRAALAQGRHVPRRHHGSASCPRA